MVMLEDNSKGNNRAKWDTRAAAPRIDIILVNEGSCRPCENRSSIVQEISPMK